MLQRPLGRTRLNVSVLGLGGHTYPVGDGGFCTYEQRAQLVQRLLEGGVNYFDTTWVNEVELLADSFRRCGGNAERYVSLQYVDGISDPAWRTNLRGELECRLEILGYERAPLFLMGVGNQKPSLSEIIAALEAMSRLKEEGLIEHIGVSCHELSRFETLADAIERTDLIDYMLLRFNYKYPDAAERLLPVAARHNIGIVGMKVFCWDCGPDQWGRRISVFEPVEARDRIARPQGAVPAQQSLRWVLQQPGIAVVVPAMNALWEVEQNLQAVDHPDETTDAVGFAPYTHRLWDREELAQLADHAESEAIRERAAALLR